MKKVYVKSGRAFVGSNQWGYSARVDSRGVVSVYDTIAGHYTTMHSLTRRQIARVIRACAR